MNIPTPHIECDDKTKIAKTVLMPGDPLRAKYIAENFLTDVHLFNKTRGMLGFTGNYKEKKVSVMGSGMGIPSSMIYFTELFDFYGVENIIRIGTAGSMQEDIHLRDIVVALSASSESTINKFTFGEINYSPTPSFELLIKTYEKSKELKLKTHFGAVYSSDQFYSNTPTKVTENMKKYGITCVEMETYGLYTVANRLHKNALGIFTISDSLVSGEKDSAKDRETSYANMMELALEVATK
ncbi:MAG: purine-nucleoside phosphorylase [Peptoniphilaceae bacterium]|nr:purine-nucleoside phosphorylase [Peptoniphilaceae bacterium]